MRIDHLLVKNFKCFRHQEFHFNKNFTVLIGDNGTGKTAILEALTVGLGSLLIGFGGIKSRAFRKEEIHVEYFLKGDERMPSSEQQYPVTVACLGSLLGQDLQWMRQLIRPGTRTTYRSADQITVLSRELFEKVQKGVDVSLPLIAYYGTGRLWLDSDDNLVPPESRMVGYRGCLDMRTNYRLFTRWFKQLELGGIQRGQSIGILEGVRQTVSKCIPNCDKLYHDIIRDELFLNFKNGSPMSVAGLSDGYRNMISLVADIAHRACRLNPHLGPKAPEKTEGVVLIDEIDLHLHPKWQRRVIDDLRDAFPNIQFITTTHSPFIIQSLDSGEVLDLNNLSADRHDSTTCSASQNGIAEPTAKNPYSDRSIEEIAENVMDLDNVKRSAKNIEMRKAAEKYYKMLERHKELDPQAIVTARGERDRLLEPYKDEVAFYTFLKMKEAAAGLAEGEE